MNISAVVRELGARVQTEVPPPTVLPFHPGSEQRGALPTLPPVKAEITSAETVPKRYGGRVRVGPYDLWLEVLEDKGDLLLILSSSDPAWADRSFGIAISGDGDDVIIEKPTLQRERDAGYVARINLGPIADLRAKLGTDLRWTVFPPKELAEIIIAEPPDVPLPVSSPVEEMIRHIQEGLRKLPESLHTVFWQLFMRTFGPKVTGAPAPAREVVRVNVIENKYGALLHKFHALRATLEVLRASATEASDFAVQRLKELAAESRHEFWAPTVWIFIKERDLLRAVVRRRTRDNAPELHFDVRSISTYVARTGKGYFTNDPKNDPHWRDTVPAQASMAAPIKGENGEVDGVICLESFREKFSDKLLNALSIAAARLVPHVHVLKSLSRTDDRWCPWHPRVQKWDAALLLRRICHAVAEAIETKIADDGIECAIWAVDRPNRELWMRAVSGYGIEYLKEPLAFDSFTGCVADCPAGTVGQGHPGENRPSTLWTRTAEGKWEGRDGHPFLNVYRRTFMGLTEAMAIPIHLADSSGKAGEASYVLGLYAYGDTAAQALLTLLSREEQIELAKLLGELMSAYQKQRERLATAYFTEMLTIPREPRDCSPIIREFTELYKLKEARVYLQGGQNNELMAVEEHGLLRPLDYDDGNWEYLNALLAQPGVPVRINNHNSRRPDVIIRDAAGWLPWHDPDRRRFLDIGIVGFGVIRLVRSGESKPFTPDDERIFIRLAALCGNALRGWGVAPNGQRNLAAPN